MSPRRGADESFGGEASARVVGREQVVRCPACEGDGYHVQKVGYTRDPHATCDVVVFDCGLCNGSGETTLDEAQRWDARRSA